MMLLSILLAAQVLLSSVPGVLSDREPMRIWFDVPTSAAGSAEWKGGKDPEWESKSLPIGNGSLGANVMGSISRERLTLNEKSLWTGGPGANGDPSYYWNCNREAWKVLPDIRQAFLDGENERAAELTKKNFGAKPERIENGRKLDRFGFMTTLGELLIETGLKEGAVPEGFGRKAAQKVNYGGVATVEKVVRPDPKSGPGETVEGYERSLSLDSALVRVQFSQDGVAYKREYFISYPDQVMAMRFSSKNGKMPELVISYLSNPLAEGQTVSVGRDGIFYSGKLKNNGERFALRVRAIAKGGKVLSENGLLKVSGTAEVVFLVSSATNYKMNFDPDLSDPQAYYKGRDPGTATAERIAAASKLGWKRLLRRHLADYQGLYNRVSLHLSEGTDSSRSGHSDVDLPTPYRLDRYREGHPDPGLEALYFQYGRYLLIASSREGDMPANLQGIWCNKLKGPWNTDYHNNINIQMNYWPANLTNLDECMPPLVDYIRSLQKPGERVARAYYNARGWTAEISSNIYGFASPGDSESMTWNLAPAGGPWLATHLWERYEFTKDSDYLVSVYDLLADAADFCCDFLWKHPDGYYTAAPSTSPEHGPVDAGATFVHAVAKEALYGAVAASTVLHTDEGRRKEWIRIYNGITPYRIGRYGQLTEWSSDIDSPEDKHRHMNHLFGLHPGHTVATEGTPELADAARVVLEHRGDAGTGWSMGWKINLWARLKDGGHAHLLLGNLLKYGTLDNLWDNHPPFQIDGNFGGSAGVAEMLLQSFNSRIELLPALPSQWQSGSVRGLCARGGFVVDMVWEDSEMKEARILSRVGGKCHLVYKDKAIELEFKEGEGKRIVF